MAKREYHLVLMATVEDGKIVRWDLAPWVEAPTDSDLVVFNQSNDQWERGIDAEWERVEDIAYEGVEQLDFITKQRNEKKKEA